MIERKQTTMKRNSFSSIGLVILFVSGGFWVGDEIKTDLSGVKDDLIELKADIKESRPR